MKSQTLLSIAAAITLVAAANAQGQTEWEEAIEKSAELLEEEKYEEALTHALQAEEIAVEEYGKESDVFAITAVLIGSIYDMLQNYDLAIQYYEQAITVFDQVGWQEYEEYFTVSLNSLGLLYYNMGRYEEAESALERSLLVYEEIKGRNSEEYRETLQYINIVREELAGANSDPNAQGQTEWKTTIGQVFELQTAEKHEEALTYALKAENIALEEYGKNSDVFAITAVLIGSIYQALQNYDLAIHYYEQAITIFDEVGWEDYAQLYVQPLNNLGWIHYEMGKYEYAESLLLKAMEIGKKQLGVNHVAYALSLNNLGALYDNMGRYEQAEPLYIKAMEIYKQQLGENHPDYATSLNNLGALYRAMGRYKKAEKLYINALEIRKEQLGEDHPDYATSVNNLGGLYVNMGRYEQAEQLFIKAMEICKEQLGENHTLYATSLNNLGWLYEAMGRYEQAEQLYIKSMEICKEQLGEDHPSYATSLSNLGALYRAMGRYKKAEPLLNKAMEIRKEQLGENHPSYATSLINLSGLYVNMGRYEQAEPLYIKAMEIYKQQLGENHPDYATSVNNLGALYDNMGRYEQAEPLYIKAMEIYKQQLGENHPDYALSLNNLGLLYYTMGRYEEAEPLYLKALEIRKEQLGEDHPSYATSLNNLGLLYYTMGRYEEAEPLYLKALEITKQQLSENHPSYATSLSNLGLLYDNMGRYEQAEQLYLKAMEIFKQQLGENHPDYASSLDNLGWLYVNMGRDEEAAECFSKGFTAQSSIILREFPAMSEKEKEVFYATMSNSFEGFHSFAVEYYEEEPGITREMYDRVLFTKGLIFYSTERVRRAVTTSGDEALQTLYDKWLASRASLARLYGMTKDERAQTSVNLDSLERAANDYEKELGRRSAAFQAEQSTLKRDWRDVRDALEDGEAAAEIVRVRRYDKEWTDEVYYIALVITPGCEAPALVVMENGAEIEERIAPKYLGELTHVAPEATTDDDPYNALWRPIEAELGGARRVFLSLDGVFNNLNVGALVDPVSNQYLMDKYDLRIVGSTKEIAAESVDYEKRNTASLFGYPDYDLGGERLASLSSKYATRGGGYGPYGSTLDSLKRAVLSDLPGTKVEVELIESALAAAGWDVKANLGDEAIEAAVKAAESPRVLHLATHGFFLRDRELQDDFALVGGFETARATENPLLRSGLYLAGAKNTLVGDRPAPGVDDGILTAYEAQHLDLRGTELVVLSACETGLGEVRNGEGVYGLRRAFQYAGAEAVMMSLWKVSDDATQKLITYFFDNRLGGMEQREAFRAAQRKLREEYPHPYYWASFVFVGK